MLKGGITNTASYPTGTTYGTDIQAAASAHAKGVYAQITASTGFACDGLIAIALRSQSSRGFIVDLATGAAGSETIRVPNAGVWTNDDAGSGGTSWNLPIALAVSTRIAARCQSSVANSICTWSVLIYAADGLASTWTGTIESYGSNLGITDFVQVDPGGVANTKSAYVQMTAATTGALRGLYYRTILKNTFPAFGFWKEDVATGAAGAEIVKVSELTLESMDLSDMIQPSSIFFEMSIPASTRIAVRAMSSIIDVSDRLIWHQFLGVPGTSAAIGGTGSDQPILIARIGAAGVSAPTTTAVDTTNATLLVALTTIAVAGPAVVTDSKSNTWVAIPGVTYPGAQTHQIFYAANPIVGTGHTFGLVGASIFGSIVVLAFKGVVAASPFDQQNSNTLTGSGIAMTTGSITPSQANSLLVLGFASGGNAATVGVPTINASGVNSLFGVPGFVQSQGGVNHANFAAYGVQGSAAAINPQWDLVGGTGINTNGTAVIASFKPAPASSGGGGGVAGGSFVFAG